MIKARLCSSGGIKDGTLACFPLLPRLFGGGLHRGRIGQTSGGATTQRVSKPRR